MNETINLNHGCVCVDGLKYGKHTIIVKIGKKLYYLDITKNAANAHIDLYKKTTKNRNDQSKYDTPDAILGVAIKNTSIIDRKFLGHLKEIKEARDIIKEYGKNIIL